jgi:hypothetical protein
MIFENMAQGFIEQHEVWTSAMVVELNQHHNSKSRNYDWDVSHFTQITQLKFEYVWARQIRFRYTWFGSKWCQDDLW